MFLALLKVLFWSQLLDEKLSNTHHKQNLDRFACNLSFVCSSGIFTGDRLVVLQVSHQLPASCRDGGGENLLCRRRGFRGKKCTSKHDMRHQTYIIGRDQERRNNPMEQKRLLPKIPVLYWKKCPKILLLEATGQVWELPGVCPHFHTKEAVNGGTPSNHRSSLPRPKCILVFDIALLLSFPDAVTTQIRRCYSHGAGRTSTTGLLRELSVATQLLPTA